MKMFYSLTLSTKSGNSMSIIFPAPHMRSKKVAEVSRSDARLFDVVPVFVKQCLLRVGLRTRTPKFVH